MKALSSFILICILTVFFNLLATDTTQAQQDMDDVSVGKYRIIHSDILNEDKTIMVSLPTNYEKTDQTYPVIFQFYAHFVPTYFSPITSLIYQKSIYGNIPEMIVVGVKNLEFRYRDLLPVNRDGSPNKTDDFLRYFEEEMIPFIEKNYRTKNYRILAGPQAAAMFGVQVLFKRPHLFDAFIITNPFLISSSRDPLLELAKSARYTEDFKNKFMFISYKSTESEGAINNLNLFSDMLNENMDSSFYFKLNILDENIIISSSLGLQEGLEFMFDGFPFPDGEIGQPLSVLQQHFKEQSERFGYSIEVPELPAIFESDKLNEAKDFDAALEIYNYCYEKFPNSLNAIFRLGDFYNDKGDKDKALQFYNQALKIRPGMPYIISKIEEIKKK